MLILVDLVFLSCLTTIAPRSVSKSRHFLNRGLPMATVSGAGLAAPGRRKSGSGGLAGRVAMGPRPVQDHPGGCTLPALKQVRGSARDQARNTLGNQGHVVVIGQGPGSQGQERHGRGHRACEPLGTDRSLLHRVAQQATAAVMRRYPAPRLTDTCGSSDSERDSGRSSRASCSSATDDRSRRGQRRHLSSREPDGCEVEASVTVSSAADHIVRDDGSVAEPVQAPLRRIAPARSGACYGRLSVTVVRPEGLWVSGMPANTAGVTFWHGQMMSNLE